MGTGGVAALPGNLRWRDCGVDSGVPSMDVCLQGRRLRTPSFHSDPPSADVCLCGPRGWGSEEGGGTELAPRLAGLLLCLSVALFAGGRLTNGFTNGFTLTSTWFLQGRPASLDGPGGARRRTDVSRITPFIGMFGVLAPPLIGICGVVAPLLPGAFRMPFVAPAEVSPGGALLAGPGELVPCKLRVRACGVDTLTVVDGAEILRSAEAERLTGVRTSEELERITRCFGGMGSCTEADPPPLHDAATATDEPEDGA